MLASLLIHLTDYEYPSKDQKVAPEEPSKAETEKFRCTVEPVIFCYAFGIILHVPIIQQYVHQRITESKGLMPYNTTGTSDTVSNCDTISLQSNDAVYKLQKEVQSEASFTQLGLVFSASFPSLFAALLLGSWSDRVGRRKVMALPVFGSLMESAVILVVMYWKLPVQTLFFAAFLNGTCGFFPTMILSVFSYIADITEASQRAFRLGILEAIAFISGMLSHLTSGWWIKTMGYRAPYWLILSLHVFALMYILLILPESRPQSVRDQSQVAMFSSRHVYAIIDIFAKPRPQGRHRMWILMGTSAVLMLCSIGFGSVIILYALDSPLCCSSIVIGYYLATSFFVQAIGAILGLKYLRLVLSENNLAQLGICSVIFSLIFMAFVRKRWLLFIVPFIACLGGVPTPLIRAMMSMMVDADEQGSLFAAVAIMETLCTLLGALIFNSLYPFFLQVGFKGFCFIVMAVLMIVPLVLMTFLEQQSRTEDKAKEMVDSEEEAEVSPKMISTE